MDFIDNIIKRNERSKKKTENVEDEIGTSLLTIKSDINRHTDEAIREIRAQSESLIAQGNLIKEHGDSIDKQNTILMEQQSDIKRQGELLENQTSLLRDSDAMLKTQEVEIKNQSKKLDFQISKLESILLNFPRLEENIIKRNIEILEEKLGDVNRNMAELKKSQRRNTAFIILLTIINICLLSGLVAFIVRIVI